MKRKNIAALAAALSLTLTALPMLVTGSEPAYDSENDPLVSLSYLNQVVISEYDEKIEALESTVSEYQNTISQLTDAVNLLQSTLMVSDAKIKELEDKLANGSTEGGLGQYEVVYLTKGSKLMAQSPLEIILRSGSAIAVSITVNGINDLTNGTELLNASEIPAYHCLLVPRGNDGRGIQITSNDAYVMVRGDYQIVK